MNKEAAKERFEQLFNDWESKTPIGEPWTQHAEEKDPCATIP